MKLAIKIGMALTTSTFALIATYAGYETKRSEAELLLDAKASNKALLAQSVPSMVKSFWSFDKTVLDASLSSFFDFGDVKKVLLFNEKGELFSGFERDKVGDAPKALEEGALHFTETTGLTNDAPPFEEGKLAKDSIEEKPLTQVGQNRLVAPLWVKPDGENPKFLGHVVFDFSTGYITKRVDDLRKRVWGLAILLSGAISLVAILYLRRAAVQPISLLAAASADVAKQIYTKVPEKNSRDEIGLLTHRFNNMVEQIQTHIKYQRKLAEAVRICSQALTFDGLKTSISHAFSLLAEEELTVDFVLASESGSEDFNRKDATQVRSLEIQSSIDGQVVAFVHYKFLADKSKDYMCLPLFEALCVTIGNTVRNIEFALQQKVHGRIEAEIEATKTIQEALIPKVSSYPNLDMAYHYKSADTTGGDWYGHHFHEETGIVYLFVGDVTGHGVPSALITGVVCGAVMSGERRADTKGAHYLPAQRLQETLQILNNVVLETGARSGKLMTMFIVALDINTGHMWTINAGHNPAIIVRNSTGQIKTLVNMGSRLGFTKDGNFMVKEYDLEPGDILFLYTDGLVENRGPNEKFLSMKALNKFLQVAASQTQSIVEVVKKVVGEGEAIWKGRPPGDDVTILAVRWTGPGTKKTTDHTKSDQSC